MSRLENSLMTRLTVEFECDVCFLGFIFETRSSFFKISENLKIEQASIHTKSASDVNFVVFTDFLRQGNLKIFNFR